MNVFAEISDIRRKRREHPHLTWGLVPTMGYLHEGHLSLIRQARKENHKVGVSIFVNPIQFNNPDDLTQYPRNPERDLRLLKAENVDLVWTPSPDQVYPSGYRTYVDVEEITQRLEGAARPGHFRGVATVVAKLFNVFQPRRAYFGQKDAQQVVVIKQMANDLNFDLDIIVGPTVREPDGLAMSSRNANLSQEGRRQAACLYQALMEAKQRIASGERNAESLRNTMRAVIEPVEKARVDYISVADPDTLTEIGIVDRRALISLAVFVENVRLIDNILIENHS